MVAGPIYLAGALATILRAARVVWLPWWWIGSGVFFGVIGALVWERARRNASTTNCS